jgi:hypothetical protein
MPPPPPSRRGPMYRPGGARPNRQYARPHGAPAKQDGVQAHAGGRPTPGHAHMEPPKPQQYHPEAELGHEQAHRPGQEQPNRYQARPGKTRPPHENAHNHHEELHFDQLPHAQQSSAEMQPQNPHGKVNGWLGAGTAGGVATAAEESVSWSTVFQKVGEFAEAWSEQPRNKARAELDDEDKAAAQWLLMTPDRRALQDTRDEHKSRTDEMKERWDAQKEDIEAKAHGRPAEATAKLYHLKHETERQKKELLNADAAKWNGQEWPNVHKKARVVAAMKAGARPPKFAKVETADALKPSQTDGGPPMTSGRPPLWESHYTAHESTPMPPRPPPLSTSSSRWRVPQDSNSGLGAALLGGAAGSFLGGHGKHGLLGAVGGALIGALGGHTLDKMDRKQSPNDYSQRRSRTADVKNEIYEADGWESDNSARSRYTEPMRGYRERSRWSDHRDENDRSYARARSADYR